MIKFIESIEIDSV